MIKRNTSVYSLKYVTSESPCVWVGRPPIYLNAAKAHVMCLSTIFFNLNDPETCETFVTNLIIYWLVDSPGWCLTFVANLLKSCSILAPMIPGVKHLPIYEIIWGFKAPAKHSIGAWIPIPDRVACWKDLSSIFKLYAKESKCLIESMAIYGPPSQNITGSSSTNWGCKSPNLFSLNIWV